MITLKEGKLRSVFAIEADDKALPANSIIMGSNGQFEVSGSDCFKFIRPANGESPIKLQKIEPGVEIVTKIAWNDFWRGPAWLRKQWDLHCSQSGKSSKEFIILLLFNPTSKQYFWHPPKQKGSSASLDYTTSDDDEIRQIVGEGNMVVGTMHNHFGKGSAFQSGTDKHDEVKHGMPMIHFTMGWMDAPHLYCSEFHIRFVAGEYEKLIEFKDIVDVSGQIQPEQSIPMENWDKKLTIEYNQPTQFSGFGGFSSDGWRRWNGMNRSSKEELPKGPLKIRSQSPKEMDDAYDLSEFYCGQGWSSIKDQKPGEFIYEDKDKDKDKDKEDSNPLIRTEMILSKSGRETVSYRNAVNTFGKVKGLAAGEDLLQGLAAICALESEFGQLITPETGSDIADIETMAEDELMEVMIDLQKHISDIAEHIGKFVQDQQNIIEKKDKEKEIVTYSE